MSGSEAVAIAVTFVWFGMVVAISLVESAEVPGTDVTLESDSGSDGWSSALNTAEAMFAVAIVITLIVGSLPTASAVSAVVAVASLVVQLVVVRPAPHPSRPNAVLAGEVAPTRSHHAYIALEIVRSSHSSLAGVTLLADVA